jgi:hypothetical protein
MANGPATRPETVNHSAGLEAGEVMALPGEGSRDARHSYALPPERLLDLVSDAGQFARETASEDGEGGVRLRERSVLVLPPHRGEIAFEVPEIGERGERGT